MTQRDAIIAALKEQLSVKNCVTLEQIEALFLSE